MSQHPTVTIFKINNWAECPEKLVSTTFLYFPNWQNQGQSKVEEEINDEGEKLWQE